MHTTELKEFAIEYYDYLFNYNSRINYQIKWKCNMIFMNTCGLQSQRINTLQYKKGSAVVHLKDTITRKTNTLTMKQFQKQFPGEMIDLRFNCHGWTFSNGFFLIMDQYIPNILSNEYFEVSKTENHDVVVFKCKETNEWIHSCKKETSGYSHKDWIKGFYKVNEVEEIFEMPQYANVDLHYFKRRKTKCNLACLRSKGATLKTPLTIEEYKSLAP